MKSSKAFFSSFFLFFVCSCSVFKVFEMSEEQCRTVDWEVQGEVDAESGDDKSEFNRHALHCGKYGVRPDKKAYFKGRERGLRTFCTYENGKTFGRFGHYYGGICPQHLEHLFLSGMKAGKEEKELKKRKEELDEREREIKRREQE